MRLRELQEMAALPAKLQKRPYYHGTPFAAYAKKMLKTGIQPSEVTGSAKWFDTGYSNRVYLTPSLDIAIKYALSPAHYAWDEKSSRERARWDIRDNGTSRFGYVFEIPGDKLIGDVALDEEELGQAVGYALDILDGVLPREGPSSVELQKLINADDKFCRRLVAAGMKAAPLIIAHVRQEPEADNDMEQYVEDPDEEDWNEDNFDYERNSLGLGRAMVLGKKVLSLLSAQDFNTLARYITVAHDQPVMPTRAWRLDKQIAWKYKQGNFQKYAQEIPITQP